MKKTSRIITILAIAGSLFSQAAHAQTYKYPYLEAECPDNATGAYFSTLTSESGYSGPGHLESVGNTLSNSYDGSSNDTASYNFEVFARKNYTIYFRVKTNGNGGDDSFFYKIDGIGWQTVNNIASQGNGWIWVSSPSFLMNAGSRTVKIANREDGLNIDKIAIIDSSRPSPTGTGGRAYNCATPLYFEAECRTQATSGYGIRHIAKSGFSGTGYLQSADDTSNVGSSQDTVTYTFETGHAPYSLHFRVHTNGSGNDDSLFYRIDGGSWQTLNGLSSLGSGWAWAAGASGYVMSKAKHTVEIANREDGLSLDKIALVPTGFSGPSGQGPSADNCYGDTDDWRGTDVYDYANGHVEYFIEEGDFILNRHLQWHGRHNQGVPINGSGGLMGAGSGVAFLGFHRAMMNRFEQFVLANGGLMSESIAIDAFLPYELPDAQLALTAAGHEVFWSGRISPDLTDIGHPGFLTVSGTFDPNHDDNVGILGGTNYAELNDIPTLDILGQLIGIYYHSEVHTRIGGVMNTHRSPADPAFYPWHGRLDRIVDVWLGTPSGQAWRAANPNHPFLARGFTDMDGWESDFWATQM